MDEIITKPLGRGALAALLEPEGATAKEI
jgi:hypothetical protein